jgi:hypothetical protein
VVGGPTTVLDRGGLRIVSDPVTPGPRSVGQTAHPTLHTADLALIT